MDKIKPLMIQGKATGSPKPREVGSIPTAAAKFTPPRYDDVYWQGVEWISRLCAN